jgi:hypothetical protein
MNCGPATSAGPTYHSVIAGTIRKANSDTFLGTQNIRSIAAIAKS